MNTLFSFKNGHTYLNYQPDMKDPRDYLYRIGDVKLNKVNNDNDNDNNDIIIFKNKGQYFVGSIILILEYIKKFNKNIYNLLGDHNDIYERCLLRYKSLNYRTLFRFFKEYITSNSLKVAYTNLLYWRVLFTDIDKTLENNIIFTGIPIFNNCLLYEESAYICKIPNHDDKFMGYLSVLLYGIQDTNYKGYFVYQNWENNTLLLKIVLIPK